MAKNTCRQNTNPVTNEVRQNAHRELWFFFFWLEVGVFDIFLFPKCSYGVLIVFPCSPSSKVPIAPHFIQYHLH
jgi:hypothetical protein